MTGHAPAGQDADVASWFRRLSADFHMEVARISLEDLRGWSGDPASGALRHRTGRFFAMEGVEVDAPARPRPHWYQPMILQPEIGILGMLVREIDGVEHCLVQAKSEPGNHNGLQISPTVQATRSNYTRAHGGRPVPYLDHFRHPSPARVLADVRQSEQASWFRCKRNRNMIVRVDEPVELVEGFRWLPLERLRALLSVADTVNMDTRTVLACYPRRGAADGERRAAHSLTELLSWMTGVRTDNEVRVTAAPLNRLPGWRWRDGTISHEDGAFFDVVGVSVEAGGREVDRWTQPMLAGHGPGVVGLLVTVIEGTTHALMQMRTDPGFLDVAEIAPTVQCVPENYDGLPDGVRPAFLDDLLHAPPGDVLFDAVLSEEGGRFYHTRNRYLVVETTLRPTDPSFRWVAIDQLALLVQHSHYVNVEARTLIACLEACRFRAPAPG